MSRRNTDGVTDFFKASKTSARHARGVGCIDATYHDDKARLRKKGSVEGGTRGLSAENVLGEFELPLDSTT